MKLKILIAALLFSTFSFAQKNPPAMKLSEPLPANLFIELAKIINPTVVNISTSTIPRGGYQRDPMLEMLEQFYGFPMGGGQQMRPHNGKPQQMALGTGFIIRDDGLILTNAHVIRGADIINVQLTEKSEKMYEAKVIGSDDRLDIALIKIQPEGKLPFAILGNSKEVQVGEWVAAFGNPFGHGHTMTKGIVSSKGREIEEINKAPLLQTDASINPGNSGGPLVDTKGFVIGVNSAIDARAQGIGFAIPIDEVKKAIPDLESRGSLRKAYLGIGLGDLDPAAAEYNNIKGAAIIKIEKNSPAQKAGLQMYDIVTEFNGKKIRNSTDLLDAISDAPIGAKANVKLMRQKGDNLKPISLDVTPIERPSDIAGKKPNKENKKYDGQKAPFNLGFSVSDLNQELRDQMDLPSDLIKPVIINVEPNSISMMVGMRPGDIILGVNKTEVSTAKEVLKNLKKGENSLKLARGNRIIIVSMSTK